MIVLVLMALLAQAPDDVLMQMGGVKRVYIDRLTGGETAAQMRDLIISSLQGSKLFVLTENADRADAFLRGAAEDLVYTDNFQSSEGVNAHVGESERNASGSGSRFNGGGGSVSRSVARSLSAGVGENEATNIHERARSHGDGAAGEQR